MKKLLIVFTLFALGIGAASYVFANPAPTPDREQCVAFKNVKAKLVSNGDGTAHVVFKSNNDGATMVTWEVRSWENGRPVWIAGGKDKVYCCDPVSSSSFSLKGFDIHDCELRIANCNSSTMY